MPAGTPVLPGNSNTYIRDHESTGRLQVDFSRKPESFALPNYIQIRPVDKDSGFYLRINTEQAGRLVGGNLTEFVWPDGADRPVYNDGTESFYFIDYRTTRNNFGFKIGQKSAEQASWAIEKTHTDIHAQRAMTARTLMVHLALGNTANWDADHVIDVALITGNSGAWDVSTTARQDIKRSINYAINKIKLDTLSKVKKEDLILVMSPDTAMAISETQEIVDHVKGSPDALSQIQGTGRWSEFGLPNKLYGMEIAVEDAVMVTSVRGASTATKSYVMPRGRVYVMSRPGGLVSEGGGPSFSTVTLFAYEEMTVERKDDVDNRRILGNVVDDVGVGVTAPAAGFYFQNVCD